MALKARPSTRSCMAAFPPLPNMQILRLSDTILDLNRSPSKRCAGLTTQRARAFKNAAVHARVLPSPLHYVIYIQ